MNKSDPNGKDFPRVSGKGSVWPIIAIIVAFLGFVALFWYFDFDPTREYGGLSGASQSDLDLDNFESFLGGEEEAPADQ